MPTHIETHEIRVFKAVCEENGFGRAAKKLHLTQSAVSQSIANLESKLDTTLVERNPLKLTATGIRLLDYAETVLGEEKNVTQDIRNIKHGILSTLQLALSGSVSKCYGDQLIELYLGQYPMTSLKLHVMPSRQIISSLRSGFWELGFGPFQKSMPKEFQCVPLFKDKRCLVTGLGMNKNNALPSDPERFLKEVPLVISHLDDPDLRPAIEKLRDSFGTIWEISDIEQRYALVRRGRAMGYFDQCVLNVLDTEKKLNPLSSFPFSEIDLTFGIYYRKQNALSLAAQNFISICENFSFNSQ